MIPKKINLTYRRKDLEEIYFRNGNGKTYFHEKFRNQQTLSGILGLCLIASLSYNPNNDYTIRIILTLIFVLSLLNWHSKAAEKIYWKQDIKNYFDSLDKYKSFSITLDKTIFTLNMDEETKIEKWAELRKIDISEGYMQLFFTGTYLIPQKSVTKEEYEFIKEFVRAKMNNEIDS